MALTEIEFELPASQYELMGYPGLQQGQALSLLLDGGVLLPDPAAESWFAVQPEPLPSLFKQIGRARYAFSGRIDAAEIEYGPDEQMAVLLVDCGVVALRVTCAPEEDGRLPYGTWETRYIAGIAHIQGIIEDDYSSGIGHNIGATIWDFRRLVLTPGDPNFGEWHESAELPPTPYHHDQVLVTARLHTNEL